MNVTRLIKIGFLVLSLLSILITIALYYFNLDYPLTGFLLSSVLFGGIAIQLQSTLKEYSFTYWVISAVVIGLICYPYIIEIGSFSTKLLIVPLLQVIMFGMGCTISLQDFLGVIRNPKGVGIGLVCQFTIMPLLGFCIAKGLNLPSDIAAGLILVGSCPSGLASNVMSYIAKANVSLSITLTAVATLISPFITPYLMQFYAGEMINVDPVSMMWSISKMVLFPVFGGLLYNTIAKGYWRKIIKLMPTVSMIGIAIIILIITALNKESFFKMGLLVLFGALIHNLSGYFFGYYIAKLFKFEEKSCRTIAMEVGLQNAGLASGIAVGIKNITIGMAAAVFGPLMNVTASALANFWRSKT